MFPSFCYLAMLNECCLKVKYKLVINLHFTASCREGYITTAMFVSALRKCLILIVVTLLKLLFILHNRLQIWGWCRWWSSLNIWVRLKKTEDNELALLDSQWTEWPLPNGCSHHLQVHCPWLKGLRFANQTANWLKNLISEQSFLHPVCLTLQAMTRGLITCPNHLVVWMSSSYNLVNSLSEAL